MINDGYPAPFEHICVGIVRNNLITYVFALSAGLTFIDVEDRSWVCFYYFMNKIIQIVLPLKMIHVSLIHVTKYNTTNKSLFCLNFRIDLFENW